jgi:hypothetical protein
MGQTKRKYLEFVINNIPMEIIMKLNESENLWEELKSSLETPAEYSRWNAKPSAIDKCIQLEEEDFDKAISLAKEWKKVPLAKSYQYDKHKYFEDGFLSKDNQPSRFISSLQFGLSYRKQGSSNQVIRQDVANAFSKQIAFLERFKQLGELFETFNHLTRKYEEAKADYTIAIARMEKFEALVKKGVSPNDFSWTMVEEVVERQEV